MAEGDFILYGYYRSSTSFRLRLALAYKGVSYDYRPVNLLDGAHKTDDYRQINPQGYVPAIVHKGQILTQSLAILEYIEELYPAPPLLWGDAARKAAIRSLAQIIACDIHPMNNLSVWKGYVDGVLGANEQQLQAWYAHWIHEGLAAYQQLMIKEGRFSCGDELSLADICLMPQLYNARRFNVALEAFPDILRIEENLLALDIVQHSMPEAQEDAPADIARVYTT